MRALVLTDGKAGHENQSKAFARALDCEVDLCGVSFKSGFAKALSYLYSRLGIYSPSLFKLANPVDDAGKYDVVIGTGSGTFYPVACLSRALFRPCGVILYPRGYDLDAFTCVLAPAFDRPKRAHNVIEIPANLVASDADFYDRGVAAFRQRVGAEDGREAVAVIVGGPNKCSTMSVEWMKRELDGVFAANAGKALWVTTSRRTPPEVEKLVDGYPWSWKLIYSNDHFNPIPAFVKLAKRLYVTAESTGMLSEACMFGTAEVVVLDNLKPGPHKFRRFVENLRSAGYVDGNRKIDLLASFAQARRLLFVS